jgi:hypothetical protein
MYKPIKLNTMPRPIFVIADEITREWPMMSYYARPYHEAMLKLSTVNDYYGNESAKDIIMYFLFNSSYWRGTAAKRIKKELKDLIK